MQQIGFFPTLYPPILFVKPISRTCCTNSITLTALISNITSCYPKIMDAKLVKLLERSQLMTYLLESAHW